MRFYNESFAYSTRFNRFSRPTLTLSTISLRRYQCNHRKIKKEKIKQLLHQLYVFFFTVQIFLHVKENISNNLECCNSDAIVLSKIDHDLKTKTASLKNYWRNSCILACWKKIGSSRCMTTTIYEYIDFKCCVNTLKKKKNLIYNL